MKMTKEMAIMKLPQWTQQKQQNRNEPKPKKTFRIDLNHWFVRKYGIALVFAAAFTLYTVVLSCSVSARTEKRVRGEMAEYYAAELQSYKAEQAEKEHLQMIDSALEEFIEQEIVAGAKLISKEKTDQVKGTKLGVAIARKLSANYPNTIQEVAAQKDQFMFYSEDNTYTKHDYELAESLIRPLYERNIIPNGLTEDMVFFEWNGYSGTARDSYETKSSMSTWRYQS